MYKKDKKDHHPIPNCENKRLYIRQNRLITV